MKKTDFNRNSRPDELTPINFNWPRVKNCLCSPNRNLYSELLDHVSSTKYQDLGRVLFQTILAGLLEGKSRDELRAEISPLIRGYRLSECETYVAMQTRKVIGWLKNGSESAPPKSVRRPKSNVSRQAAQKPPVAHTSSLEARESSSRLKLIREIGNRHRIENPNRLVLTLTFDPTQCVGSYSIVCRTTGRESSGRIEAGCARHFQLLVLKEVLSNFAPTGNVELECDNLDLVSHFGEEQLLRYRQSGWKNTNGDWLRFRDLYEQLDGAFKGRAVRIMLPEESGDTPEAKNSGADPDTPSHQP